MIKQTTFFSLLLILGLSASIKASINEISKNNSTNTLAISKATKALVAVPSITLNGDEIIFGDNFDSISNPLTEWYQQYVDTSIYYNPNWIVGTNSPYQGDGVLYYNSSYGTLTSARLVVDSLDFTSATFVYLDFYMYHNSYLSSDCDESLQIQVSTDSINWESIGEPIYVGGEHYLDDWYNHQIDLSAYVGQNNVYIGLLGKASYYCNNINIDSLLIKSASTTPSLPAVKTDTFSDLSGEQVTLHGIAIANASSAEVVFEYDTLVNFTTSKQSSSVSISGFFKNEIKTTVSGLKSEKDYYYRMMVSNTVGDSIGDIETFTTPSISAPSVTSIDMLKSDGNEIYFEVDVDGNNGFTSLTLNYGLDTNVTSLINHSENFADSRILNFTIKNIDLAKHYYYKLTATNSAGTIVSDIDSVDTPEFLYYDTLIHTDAFLKGKYVNIGVASSGVLGTDSVAPDDMHPRVYSGDFEGELGFVADVDKDGWYTGTPGFVGDYFLPGSPEEGWGLTINGTSFNNNGNDGVEITGSITRVFDTSNYLIADWNGEIEGLAIEQRIKLPIDSLYFMFEVTLSNTTDSTMHNFYYMRNVDPDNENTLTENYATFNEIVYQNPGLDNKVLVSATGKDYNTYLGLCANDRRARVTHGGFSNRYPNKIWEGIDLNIKGKVFEDEAISLAFKIDSLQAGECTTLIYAYVLSEEQVSSALRATMLNLGVEGKAGIASNVEVCKGSDVVLTINNGADYSWVWTDKDDNVVSTGVSLNLSNINVGAVYKAIGSFHCFDTTFNIIVTPVEYPVGTASNNNQTILTGATFENIVLGTSNSMIGTNFAWTRNSPSGLETTMPLSGVVEPGNNLVGYELINNSTSEISMVINIVPMGPSSAFCEGEPLEATIKVTPAVSAIVDVSSHQLSLYPNPNNGVFTLHSAYMDEVFTLKIVSVSGQVVEIYNNLQNESRIDLGELPAGIYFVNITSRNVNEQVKMIIE